ncbi:M48 family metalloprotease [Novosphingobium sp. Chol11]|uniref:M48 family metalloprotease n=1 Tax=Novosphingobium sp. Chol11 TaxID=1385763 RepID=UPI0025E72A5D|nr:M48 family metalloprotease [Novosphingobium sp. Chol11]
MALIRRISMLASLALAAAPLGASAAGFDVEHATQAWLATLSPAARVKSDAYFDGSQWNVLFGTVISVFVCWLMLRLRVLPGVRDAMQRRGWRPWLGIIACAITFLAANTLITLPWTIYTQFWREQHFGLMNQSLGAWLGDQAIGFVLTILIGGPLLLLTYVVIRRWPRRWWLIGSGLVSALVTLAVLVSPVFIAPLFNTYTPMPQGPVRDRIVAMAKAYQVPADQIYVADESRQSDRISANVSGLGPTIRVTLNDNLLKQPPAMVAAVMGHELGHYVLGHSWRLILLISLLFAAQFWIAAMIVPAAIRLGGQRWKVRAIGDPASMPVFAAVLAVLSLVSLPLLNTVIRVSESEADAFGLDAAREPDAFAATAMKLSNYRKIAPGALEEAVLFDHPSGRTRVRMAMQWKKDHVPGARETVILPLP